MIRSKKKMNFVQKMWRLLKPFQPDLYKIFVVTAIFESMVMAGPFLFGKILDLLISSGGSLTPQTILIVIGGLAGVRFIVLLSDYVTDIIIVRLLWRTERYVSSVTFSKLLELSMDYHERENTGAKINLVNKGRERLIDLMIAYTFEFQPIILQLLVTCVLIALTNWHIGLLFSVSLLPFSLITWKTFQASSKWRSKRHDAYETSSGEIGDTISNITVVKAYAQEQREEKSFESLWDTIKDLSVKEFNLHIIIGFFRSILVEICYILLVLIGILEIKNGAITVGSLVFVISLIERAYSHIYRLGRIYERAVDAAEPVDRITRLLGQEPSIKNALDALVVPELKGQISFKHVTFAYKTRRVLKNVSFTIPAGSFTAFVGKSGGGKSTIAKLISRYYDPTRGSIVIDGKYDLKKLDLDTFREQTSVVFQDSPVPNRKVWEVISYSAGKKNFASVRSKVYRAAKLAYADEFIAELPEGYQTQIGERGVKLSGGQKQRLAIARALFANPKILIMDEPTSHLDTHSESLIQQALKDLSKERSFTKIIIAHRLSTVQQADQILVMDKGKLVERGNHKTLLARKGIYAQIVAQSELKG
ncbi:MAG: ATP-binding cassette, subfamily B, bacterial [Microgenomates group bacterium Gr01-1014_80]|nr:MAG: ATP-binding cassette, subfamily B, bacterial [Microgenomates group bacterium Gr01-1014_80]